MSARPTSHATALLLALATSGVAHAADDCNANGIPDDIELAPVPDFLSQEHAVGCTPFSIGGDTVDANGLRVPFDVDGDGDTDLVAANHGAGSVTVLLNNGAGAFTFSATVQTGGAPWSAEAGDLDGDGDPDLVVTDIDAVIHILLNNGAGLFTVDATLATGNGSTAAAVSDLDGDGDLDIAVTVQGNEGGIRLFFNQGDATFDPAQILDGAGSNTIAAGDLDGDGDDDLLIREGQSSIRVFLNSGGAFPFQAAYACGGVPHMIELGDMDGDGDLDALVAHGFVSGAFSVLTNQGDGTFAAPVSHAGSDEALHALPADIDGDGDLDVVVVDGEFASGRSLVVLRNAGDGTLAHPLDVPGGSSFHCAAGDFDGDGITDLAAGRNGACFVSVHLQDPLPPVSSDCNGNGVPDACDAGSIVLFDAAETYGVGEQPVSVIASATRPSDGAAVPFDLNGDGHVDAAAVNEAGSTLSVLMNEGTLGGGEWLGFADSIELEYTVGDVAPVDLAAGDLDGDGDQDVVTVAIGTGFLTLFRNLGDGALDAAANTQQGDGLAGVVLADFDDDGDLDVAVTDEANDRVAIVENPGDANWDDSPALVSVGGLPRGITKGDLDGDGDVDLAVANQQDGTVTVLFGDGAGGFPETIDVAVGGEPFHLAAADIDGDGALDLAVVDANNFGGLPGLIVLHNDGAGGFELQATYMTGDQPRSVHAADLDDDGRLDLIVANRASDTMTVLMNAGGGQLAPVATHDVGQVPGRAVAADVDGSGDLDLLSADQFDDTVSVLLHDAVLLGDDLDGNGVPDACEETVPGDANGDGLVDVSDLILVVTSWGACPTSCPADLDGNGTVDVIDLVMVVVNWG